MKCIGPFFHSWNRWVTYEQTGIIKFKSGSSIDFTSTRQRRSCAKCGREQDQELIDGPDGLSARERERIKGEGDSCRM